MKNKRVLCPERLRQLPPHWSWVDHRLVRDDYVGRCDAPALALYLFLVCVADAQGLSYYSDRSISGRLHWAEEILAGARSHLQKTGLIAYEKPLYQVLELRDGGTLAFPRRASSHDGAQIVPIAEVVRKMFGGAA